MSNSLIKTPSVTGYIVADQPPTEYQPAQPARTVVEERYVCGFRYSGPGHYTTYTDPITNVTTAHFVPDSVGQGGGEIGTWGCAWESVQVTYPATPEIPASPGTVGGASSDTTGFNLGWNSGGRSIAFVTNDGYVTFQARSDNVGAIVGLNLSDSIGSKYNGNNIEYAFSLSRGMAHIMQNGVLGAYVGSYVDSTVFKVARVGTGITWYMDGVSVGTAAGAGTGAAWLEAALYAGQDEIFNPSIVQVSSADLTTLDATLAGTLPKLTFFGSDHPYAELNGVLEALTADLSAGLGAPSFAVANFVLPPLAFHADGLSGEIGEMHITLPKLKTLMADHPYGQLDGVLPHLFGGLFAYEGNTNASMGSIGGVNTRLTAATFLVVQMHSDGHYTATMVNAREVSAQMLSEAEAGSEMALNAILQAVMVSMGKSGAVIGVPATDSETWVLNIDSGGSTTYSGYGFNSYAEIGGRYYGARSDGIYLLEGDTDDGEPIRASVSLGELDFGTPNLKTVSECYVGMSGNGNLYLKLIVEGRSFVYKTRTFSPRMQQQRMTSGKGLRTNYVTAELFNENGSDFELDTVLFQVADLTRRI